MDISAFSSRLALVFANLQHKHARAKRYALLQNTKLIAPYLRFILLTFHNHNCFVCLIYFQLQLSYYQVFCGANVTNGQKRRKTIPTQANYGIILLCKIQSGQHVELMVYIFI